MPLARWSAIFALALAPIGGPGTAGCSRRLIPGVSAGRSRAHRDRQLVDVQPSDPTCARVRV